MQRKSWTTGILRLSTMLVLAVALIGLPGRAYSEPDTDSGENYTSANIGTLVYVPAGSFQRDDDEENISIISQPYRMSEHQITQAQFEAVMGVNPSSFSSGDDAPNRPVERVGCYDAITSWSAAAVD